MYLLCQVFERRQARSYWRQCQKGVLVITINKFGGVTFFNEGIGWLYEENTKEEYTENLKKVIIEGITKSDEVTRHGKMHERKQKSTLGRRKTRSIRKIIGI